MKISVSLIDWLANQLSNFVIFRIVNNEASINIFKRNCCKILSTIVQFHDLFRFGTRLRAQ